MNRFTRVRLEGRKSPLSFLDLVTGIKGQQQALDQNLKESEDD